MFHLPPIALAILALIVAACVGLAIVPVAKKWGRRFGLVDQPDKKRKLHANSIPLVGGIAIFITFLLTLPIVAFLAEDFSLIDLVSDRSMQGLFLASLVILGIGILDDRFEIRGRQKLLGQIAAASILIYFGYRFDIVSVFGIDLSGENPVFYYLVAYAWILIGINSVNLLDGADGFASTIGFVTCIALCVMAIGVAQKTELPAEGHTLEDYVLQVRKKSPKSTEVELLKKAKELQAIFYTNLYLQKQPASLPPKQALARAEKKALSLQYQQAARPTFFRDGILAALMAGAILAFLRFNFPPATAFLGDAGSMLIGLFIAAMAIKTGLKQNMLYAFLAPIALLAIPLFDTFAAIIRRKLTGRSIYDTDRGHIHHAIISKGFGPRKSLLLFFSMCLMTATGGTMALIYEQAEYAVLAIIAVAVFLVVGRIFGVAEFKLISHGSSSVIRSILPTSKQKQNSASHSSIRIQGHRDWEICWQVLREFAETQRINQLSLDLNLPWIHESFHGKYKSEDKSLMDDQWSLELPLIVDDRSVGRLKLQASEKKSNYAKTSVELEAALNSLQPYIAKTMADHLSKIPEDQDEIAAEQQSIEFGGVSASPKDATQH